MGKSCCEGHTKTSNGLWYRSSTLVLSGLLLYIPYLETLLSTGALGWAFFALCTSLIVWTLVKDYRQEIGFCMATILTTALVLSAPLMHSANMSALSIIIALVVNAGLLFTKKYEALPTVARQQVTKQPQINREGSKKSLIGWTFPTVEKIILLLAVLNWGISLGSLLMPGAGVFLFSLHDTLLILGIYNAATYVKQRVQTSALPHNHHREVTKINADGKEEKILLSELKRGIKKAFKFSNKFIRKLNKKIKPNSKWRIKKIKTQFQFSLGGSLGPVKVSGIPHIAFYMLNTKK